MNFKKVERGECCAVRAMHNTTNYKLEQLIYICQSVPSFLIGCGDVLLVVWRCCASQCRTVVSNSRQ